MAMKVCKECGTEISKGAKVCPKCGKDQRTFFQKHPILTVLLVLIGLGVIGGMIGGSDTPTTPTSTTNPTTSISSNQPQETIYNVGDTIQSKKYEITIESVSERAKVGTKYLSATPSEGGTYVAVDFKYKNTSDKPINSWDFPTVKLVDSNGVEYSSDISASSYYATEMEPDRKILSELNPGITVKDNAIFEISTESYSNGEWFLVIDYNTKVKIK